MVFEKGTSDYFVYNTSTASQRGDAAEVDGNEQATKQTFRREIRTEKLKEKMVTNNAWMKGLSHEEVQKVNNDYQKWKEGEEMPPPQEAADADVTMEG